MPNGVSRMTDADLAANSQLGSGFTNSRFVDCTTGYFGALYQNSNTEDPQNPRFIYANRGTEGGMDGLKDWLNNDRQALGFSAPQFEQGVKIGRQLSDALGDQLSFTGHSLGGALAAAQALATGRTAITFNAEGLSNGTVRRFNLDTTNASKQITAFNINGELLSRLQDNPLSSAVMTMYGTVPKNIFAATGVGYDVANGQKPDFSSFGLPIVGSAYGARVAIPAVDLNGQALNSFERLTNSLTLHGMDYVTKGLQGQVGTNGALPADYLRNIRI